MKTLHTILLVLVSAACAVDDDGEATVADTDAAT